MPNENHTFRRVLGPAAAIVFAAFILAVVPQAIASGNLDQFLDKRLDDGVVERAPGDNDNIGGAKLQIRSQHTVHGDTTYPRFNDPAQNTTTRNTISLMFIQHDLVRSWVVIFRY